MFLHKLPATLLAVCSSALLITSVNAAEVPLDSTAAVVNNDIILESELNNETRMVEQQLARSNRQVDNLSARKAALERLITRSLVLQMARAQGIALNDMQLEEAINTTATQNGVTPSELLHNMAPDMTEAQAREKFRDDLILNEVQRNRVRSRINISDTEVDLLARNLRSSGSVEPQYHLAQIIVPVTDNNAATAARTMDSIRAQLRAGADFNALAARYSQGSVAAQAGDLGYLPETQVPVPFLPALLKAKPGDVIGPFRSPFGLHLLKLIDVTHDSVNPITLYNASHILLQTSVIFSDESARLELNNLRRQIVSGQISFAEAARRYSEDPGSAITGGSLGYATPEKYDPAFARAMVALKPGQISEPIKSSFGWHLIYLQDMRIDKDSDEAYKQKARDLIYRRAYQEQAVAWERELRDSAYIHVLDPVLTEAHIDLDQTSSPAGN